MVNLQKSQELICQKVTQTKNYQKDMVDIFGKLTYWKFAISPGVWISTMSNIYS